MTLAAVLAMGASSDAMITHHTTVLADSTADAYSVNDITGAASRDTIREAIAKHENGATDATVFATVVIDGQTKIVSSDTAFTDVRSVLEAGNITLAKGDSVSPSLDSAVDESTVITITSSGSDVITEDSDIDFNTVTKEDPTLDKGTTKVESEGAKGVMETVSLVSKTGDTVTSKNTLSSYVKAAPQDRVVLVGTKTASSSTTNSGSTSSGSTSLGVTTPASEMQTWAHDYLIGNSYTEDDFTALVYIISHESGWRVDATNASSGAYGLPQALPGSKMASAGSDWQTNYQTQIKWFVGYCNGRYGGITAAYNHWQTYKSY
ncbi:MAG: G5 domain-containing protein [Bifidobacteriaceae bacterium]|nr:G5 domain-containing protein [Bifidobacteriaceae bacterium]